MSLDPFDDYTAEQAELAWQYERRRRRLRTRAIVAAVVVITLIMLTVLPYFVRVVRGRSTPTTTTPVIQVLGAPPGDAAVTLRRTR